MRTGIATPVLESILWIGLSLWLGAALIIYSERLSRRLTEWDARLRERDAKWSLYWPWPPTPKSIARWTKIMTWFFRAVAVSLFVIAFIEFMIMRLQM